MPRVIIQADLSGDDATEITLAERVVAANFESPHFAAQLIQRLGWATADAEDIEAG